MESSAEIGKIKNEAEKLNEEARLEVLSEQDRQAGFAGSSEYEGNERVSEPGKVRVREVREAVVADLNGERFSAGENPEIRQAAGGVRSVNHAEDVKKVITDTLSKESYAPAEGMKIKPPADQSIQLKIRAAQRTKAVRDAFMEFGSRINEVWELLNVKKDSPEKGSVYYKQMRDAAEWVKVLTERLRENEEDPEHSKSAAPSEGTLVEAMMRLSETSHIYYDTHRGWRAFKKGENRKEACSRIREQGSKIWVNTIWPSLCGGYGHDDDAAFLANDPGSVYQPYLDAGVSMIQTDRPQLLIPWLTRQGRHSL